MDDPQLEEGTLRVRPRPESGEVGRKTNPTEQCLVFGENQLDRLVTDRCFLNLFCALRGDIWVQLSGCLRSSLRASLTLLRVAKCHGYIRVKNLPLGSKVWEDQKIANTFLGRKSVMHYKKGKSNANIFFHIGSCCFGKKQSRLTEDDFV